MTFLAPTSALIAAGIAVPLLVTLYLLKLRRRPLRVSTTIFWEQAEEDLQANVPLRWLRPSWLLLLHLLILALLILALGRPAAELPSSFGDASRVIVMIDRSASMSAKDGGDVPGMTRLDAAKEAALRAIDELSEIGGGRSAMVVSFAHDTAALTRWTASRGLLKDAVRSIEATDQPANLAGAIELVSAIAAGNADEETAQDPPLVLVYSDGSFRTEGPIRAAGLRVKLESVPKAAEPVAAMSNAAQPPDAPTAASQAAASESHLHDNRHDNVGIIAIAARRDYADPTRVRVLVRLQNAGKAVSAPVAVSLNGEVIERRVVDVPGFGEDAPELPGVAAATFEFLNTEGGLVLAQVGRDDLLASDNAASLVLSRPDRAGILLYRPLAEGPVAAGPAVEGGRANGDEGALAPSDWLLEDALRELRPRALTIKRVAASFALDAADLDGVDLVIFDRVTPTALPPVPSLSLGAVPPGLGVRAGGTPAPREGEGRADAGPVLLWERSHPLLRDVALDSLFVGQDVGLVVEAPPEGVKVTDLARSADRTLMVLAEAKGLRHVATGFELAQSNWPSQISFPIFLASAVDYLTLRGETSLGRSFSTSQAVTLAVRPAGTGSAGGNASLAPITLRGPVEVQATPRADGEVFVGVLARAGVYLVDSPRTVDRAVAVNLVDATESALKVERELTIGATASVVGEGKARKELWPWFVLAAAGLLVIEWIVYAVRMRA